MTNNKKPYLNLGCGATFSRDWVNIDFSSNDTDVIKHDLSKGLPFQNSEFAVVYHSHVLEHFSRQGAETLLSECYRILKPGGIIRVIVPDLEQLARCYLQNLVSAEEEGGEVQFANHEWSTIELLDQLTRTQTGGEMGKYCAQDTVINEAYVLSRVGPAYLEWRKNKVTIPEAVQKMSLKSKLDWHWKKWLRKQAKISEFEWYETLYSRTGERHKWMYDKLSLKRLLESIGFKEVTRHNGFSSSISDWNTYNWLDITNGQLRKPDSLIIEAIR